MLAAAALAAAALAASVMSCNRDQVVPVPDAPPAITQANQELAAVAKALARTLGSEAAYRQLLKAEALKQFDGDYDVLYRAFAAQQPTFGQHMDELVAQSPGGQPLTGMADVLAHVPNLNISVPVNITKWSADTYAPLVLFIPADFDEKTYTKPLQAYDKDGQVHLLDAKKAPDYPVVVIGPSERVKGTALTSENFGPGKGANSLIGGKVTNRLADPVPPADDPSNPYYPPSSPPPSTPPQYYATCRNDKQVEYLRSLWMEDVSVYEAWLRGGPEIRLKVFFANGSNGVVRSDGWDISRDEAENTWSCDNQLFYWDKNLTGNAIKFVWYEQDDNGEDVTYSFAFESTVGGVKSTTSVSYTLKSGDDVIGESLIDFEFCPREKYYELHGGTNAAFRWTQDSKPQ